MATAFERPSRITLENGLSVLSLRRSASPVVAVLVMYNAGSIRDPERLTGLAHLTEHMMFRGSRRYADGAIDELTNSIGGVNNAMTTSDYAAYYFVLPRENWRTALEIEADRMTGCLLAPPSFETERSVAIEERQMLDDDPEAVLDEAVEFMSYDHHPYRFPVVGLLEDLERVSRDDLLAFYRANYVPDNAVLSVVGDVEPSEVENAVSVCFEAVGESLPVGGSGVGWTDPPPDPPQSAARRLVIERDSGIPRLTVAFRCPEAAHSDSPAVEMVATILGTGRSSRLYTSLVASGGDVNEVSVGRTLQRCQGLFTVSGELSEGGDLPACEAAVLGEIARLAHEAPAIEELQKARLQWRLDHTVGRESSLGMAGFLGYWELLDRWELGEEFDRRVNAVTPEDVSRAARLYLDPEVRNSGWLTIRQG